MRIRPSLRWVAYALLKCIVQKKIALKLKTEINNQCILAVTDDATHQTAAICEEEKKCKRICRSKNKE